MKKLLIVCGVLLGAGVCMMLGGWAAGGMLYGAYYNGALHPVRETVRDAVNATRGALDGVREGLCFRRWQDENGVWHSGWISVDDALDYADERVDDALDYADERVDDALDRVEDALDRAEDAVTPYDDDAYDDDYDDYDGGYRYHHAEQNRHGW